MKDIHALAYRIRHALTSLHLETARVTVKLAEHEFDETARDLQDLNLFPVRAELTEFTYLGVTFTK
ncbi:hypothetical protein [Rhizobium phage RHph_X2_24]|nr:hypothetical protein [Rhizobium phage RHph_X2_24]